MTASEATEPSARLRLRERVLTAFLDEHGERLARVAHDVARRFDRGGLLLVHGTGSAATDAAHVVVAFMHPAAAGKRALPALAPSNDPTGAMRRASLLRADDIALSITHGPGDDAAGAFLNEAGRRGALTISLTGSGEPTASADHVLTVDSTDPQVVQEVQAVAHNVLWESVHAFFEHPELLEEACITCGDIALPGRVVALTDGGATLDFDGLREEVACELIENVVAGDVLLCHAGVALERLDDAPADGPVTASLVYPFLTPAEGGVDAVLCALRDATAETGGEVLRVQRGLYVERVDACAGQIRERLTSGGRVLSFGNGASATDAQDLAGDLLDAGWTATALGSDAATVTALAADFGVDEIFSRQVAALGRSRDVAVALSAGGSSQSLILALGAASQRGMLTCAVVGEDEGLISELEWLDHLLVVPSDSAPRVQEAQATICHLILEAIGSPT